MWGLPLSHPQGLHSLIHVLPCALLWCGPGASLLPWQWIPCFHELIHNTEQWINKPTTSRWGWDGKEAINGLIWWGETRGKGPPGGAWGHGLWGEVLELWAKVKEGAGIDSACSRNRHRLGSPSVWVLVTWSLVYKKPIQNWWRKEDSLWRCFSLLLFPNNLFPGSIGWELVLTSNLCTKSYQQSTEGTVCRHTSLGIPGCRLCFWLLCQDRIGVSVWAACAMPAFTSRVLSGNIWGCPALPRKFYQLRQFYWVTAMVILNFCSGNCKPCSHDEESGFHSLPSGLLFSNRMVTKFIFSNKPNLVLSIELKSCKKLGSNRSSSHGPFGEDESN